MTFFRCALQRIVTCVVVSTIVLPIASGVLRFEPSPAQVRVYSGAPAGLYVTRVTATLTPADPGQSLSYSMPQHADHVFFRIDPLNGTITTKRRLSKPLGSTYTLMAVVKAESIQGQPEEEQITQITVEVSEKNLHKPYFSQDIYTVEILRSHAYARNTLFVASATDDDFAPYNKQILYSIVGDMNNNAFLNIDPNSGRVWLRKQNWSAMARIPAEINATLLARDVGSPPYQTTTLLFIHLKRIPAPKDLRRIDVGNQLYFCWRRLEDTTINGYMAKIKQRGEPITDVKWDLAHLITPDQINSTTAWSGLEEMQCSIISNLRPGRYSATVHGWNRVEVGLASQTVNFTKLDACVSKPCVGGTCVPAHTTAGYFCNCGNVTGTLSCPSPCLSSPCHHAGTCTVLAGGQYRCDCTGDWTGPHCTQSVFCLTESLSCLNGGVCQLSPEEDSWRCTCTNGFTGDRCQTVGLCNGAMCQHGGTCSYTSDIPNCDCTPEYTGSHCELSADFCAGSPCVDGATCVPGHYGFTCLCPPGVTGRDCQAVCPAVTEEHDCRSFLWEATTTGRLIRTPCHPSKDGRGHEVSDGYDGDLEWTGGGQDVHGNRRGLFAWRRCQRDGVWAAGNYSECDKEEGDVYFRCEDAADTSGSTVAHLSAEEFTNTATRLSDDIAEAKNNASMAWSVISAASRLIEAAPSASQLSHRQSNSAVRHLADALTALANEIHMPPNKHAISLRADNVVLNVVEYKEPGLNRFIEDGLVIGLETGAGSDRRRRQKQSEHEDDEESKTIQKIQVPFSALSEASRHVSPVRLSALSYTSSSLFPSRQRHAGPDPGVVTITFPGYTAENLSEPITYSFGFPGSDNLRPVCVYWDESVGSWSTAGVTTTVFNGTTICSTEHLSSFSILFDPVGGRFSALHETVLSIISITGSSVSLCGLAFTIFTYSLFRKLNRDHQGSILLNLCWSLLMMNLTFLLSTLTAVTITPNLCLAVAVAVQYFVLTSLGWMLVEAINMYQLLIRVFATSEKWFMQKRLVLAWGVPAVLVIIAVVSGYSSYVDSIGNKSVESVHPDACVITARQPIIYHASFFAPGCIILLINSVIFVMVVRVVLQQRDSRPMKTKTKRSSISPKQVRGMLTVMTLLGIGWILGSLAVGPGRLVVAYLFVLVNSSQGFIVFVVRCLQYPPARQAWLRLCQSNGVQWSSGGRSPGNSGYSKDTVSVSIRSGYRRRQPAAGQSTSVTLTTPSHAQLSNASTERVKPVTSEECRQLPTQQGGGDASWQLVAPAATEALAGWRHEELPGVRRSSSLEADAIRTASVHAAPDAQQHRWSQGDVVYSKRNPMPPAWDDTSCPPPGPADSDTESEMEARRSATRLTVASVNAQKQIAASRPIIYAYSTDEADER